MNTIKFLHLSDSHIGKTHKSMRNDPITNRNLMTLDAENQLEKQIDLAIEEKVDFIIHAGDLFDKINSRNVDIQGGLKSISKLRKNNIPFFAIAGNHDRPFTKGLSSPIKFLEYLPHCYVFPEYGNKTITFSNQIVSINGVSFIKDSLYSEFPKISNSLIQNYSGDYNILIAHQSIEGFDLGFEIRAANEPFLSSDQLPTKINYAAMGHIHQHQSQPHPLNENAIIHYPGSPIIIDFGERNDKKSASIVSITGKEVEIETFDLPLRDFKEIKLEVQNPEMDDLDGQLRQIFEQNIDPELYLGIRVSGSLQLTLKKLLNDNNYNEYRKSYAGYKIYNSEKLIWYDKDGKSVYYTENWLLDPIEELKIAVNEQEGLSDQKKNQLLKLGSNIIQEYKEVN